MRDVIALENKEPEKKKGTLWKSRPRGGRFGKSSESRDITSIKNFLKKIVYKADITPTKNFLKKIAYKQSLIEA